MSPAHQELVQSLLELASHMEETSRAMNRSRWSFSSEQTREAMAHHAEQLNSAAQIARTWAVGIQESR